MPNKTNHIALNQWEGTDPFLRMDFNEDNAKIDAAVADLDTRLCSEVARLEDDLKNRYSYLSQAMHETALLIDAENYYTGARRGLILDGFTSENRLAWCSETAFLLPHERRLAVGNHIPTEGAVTHGAKTPEISAGVHNFYFTRDFYSTLTSFSVYAKSAMVGMRTLTYTIYTYDQETQTRGQMLYTGTAPVNIESVYIARIVPCNHILLPGSYNLEMSLTTGAYMSSEGLPYATVFEPQSCTSGEFRSIFYPFADFGSGEIKAYVRHSQGSAALTLTDGASRSLSVPRLSSSPAVNIDGRACYISEYALPDAGALQDGVTVSLALDCTQTGGMDVYNYGVIFI